MMYGLTLSLKNEIVKIAPKGRVNCIAPGLTRTVRHACVHLGYHIKNRFQANGRSSIEKSKCFVSRTCYVRFHSQGVRPDDRRFHLIPTNRTALNKVAMPSDIASQIAIISSQAVSGHISGEVLMITGGLESELFCIYFRS